MNTIKLRKIFAPLLLAIGMLFATVTVAAPPAHAVTTYFVSNQDADKNVRVLPYGSSTYSYVGPYSKLYFAYNSQWLVNANWACTWHTPYGSYRTTYGGAYGIWYYLTNSVIVDDCWRTA